MRTTYPGQYPPTTLYGTPQQPGGSLLGGGNALVIVGVVVIITAAFGMLCYQRHLKRKKEEYDSLVKTLAPAIVALLLVGYLGFNAPGLLLEKKDPPEHYRVGLASRSISGIPLKVFVILAFLTVGLHFALRSSTMARMKSRKGAKHKLGKSAKHKLAKTEELHPVWIRGQQNLNFPFRPAA